MFPLLKKHLYLGQSVDGYSVVNFNSNYTGGIMRTPYINDPLASNGHTYAETESDLSSFNSGGSVLSQLGGWISSSFTDWRIPSKTEMQGIVNIAGDDTTGIVTSNRMAWTSTNGTLDPASNKFTIAYSSTGTPHYTYVEYNKTNEYGAFFIRDFTL